MIDPSRLLKVLGATLALSLPALAQYTPWDVSVTRTAKGCIWRSVEVKQAAFFYDGQISFTLQHHAMAPASGLMIAAVGKKWFPSPLPLPWTPGCQLQVNPSLFLASASPTVPIIWIVAPRTRASSVSATTFNFCPSSAPASKDWTATDVVTVKVNGPKK
ncbi:MAG: hypothetical protein R3F30_11310 [Planctomycetota bacterium]